MQPLDWIVISIYFLALLAIAWWVIRQRQDSSADYFLAGRNVGWFVIGASLFASNIGSEHLVGLAGTGAEDGVAMAHYELHAWCLLVLGWVLVPFYARSLVFTMPEFLERRYNPAARWLLSLISLISYVFTKIAVALFAAGIVFETIFPERLFENISNFWIGAIGVVIITGLYTVFGGLRAVVYTEVLQTIVLIVGSLTVTFIGLHKLGGWGELRAVCGSDYFNLWKPMDDPKFPWLGMLIGAPIVGLWYWCTDQYIVQRTLAAANQTQARRGTIFAAYMKMLPLFIFIVPGMIAYALATTGQMDPTVLEPGGSNQAFPLLVRELLPAGVRGLVVGGLLAALMSSLAAVFNSSSTLFTMDIYKKIHPQASEHTLVWVGRLATVVMVIFGLLWIPFILKMGDTLYGYLQSVQSYLAPPIAAVFFLGIFVRRINSTGCMAGLIGGFVLGIARLIAELNKQHLEGTWLYGFADLNFLYFCIVLAAASVIIIVSASLLSAPPSAEKINGLTYATLTAEDRQETRQSWNKWDVFHTCMVLVLIVSIYLYFTG